MFIFAIAMVRPGSIDLLPLISCDTSLTRLIMYVGAVVFWRAPTRYRNRHRNFLIPGNTRIPPRVVSRVGGSERDIYEGDER